MRVEIKKGDQIRSVKENNIQRFLEQGWQRVAQPAPEKVKPKAAVKAKADLIEGVEDEFSLEAPLISMPTYNQQGD